MKMHRLEDGTLVFGKRKEDRYAGVAEAMVIRYYEVGNMCHECDRVSGLYPSLAL